MKGRTIVFAPEAAKELDALDATVLGRVVSMLHQLALNPLALRNQIKRLKGDPAMRLRVGDWRIMFDGKHAEIVWLAIGRRSAVYRMEQ